MKRKKSAVTLIDIDGYNPYSLKVDYKLAWFSRWPIYSICYEGTVISRWAGGQKDIHEDYVRILNAAYHEGMIKMASINDIDITMR